MAKAWWLLLPTFLLGGASAVLAAWSVQDGPGEGRWVALEWPEGIAPSAGAELLTDRGLLSHPSMMAAYLRLASPFARPKSGFHLLRDNLSPKELLEHLARMSSRPRQRVVLPEGWNHAQIAERLESRGICSAVAFRAAVFDPQLADELKTQGPSLEGYLFPNTYELFVNSSARVVASLLVKQARQELGRLRVLRRPAFAALETEFGWGDLEVLTLGSMIEEETAAPEERSLIASVFFNRLRSATFKPARMLQSDPTAAYGCLVAPEEAPSCAGYDRRITPQMVRDPDNAYNTYRHPGLPPGPISNPGTAAIEAVLRPEASDYLFFVARGDGHHHFSRSLQEHNARIRAPRAR